MKKRWTAALLALLLAVSLLPGAAWAAEGDGSAGSRLTGVDRAVYDILKAEVLKIASGSQTSTAIKIPNQSALSWTLKELGMSSSGGQNNLDKVAEKFNQSLHLDRIYICLSMDLPYEMYWKSNQFSWSYSLSRSGDRASIVNLLLRLEVAQAYRGGSDTTLSAAKAAAAKQAAQNAQAIVDKHRDKSDYEKLNAYREEICQLVSYDTRSLSASVPYGDPWQMIYVFDGDPSTNVVCEGYAKAFKYLCDLSDFEGDITCRLVNGYMSGRHMWNVVTMDDGQNYLVDVTNCDSGMTGADDKLFLVGGSGSEDGRTWTVTKDGCREVYLYAEEQKDLYVDGYLPLSPTHYDPDAVRPEPTPSTHFTDVDPGQYYAQPVAWALEEGIAYGTSENAFSPGQPCTHAQILTFLWRAKGQPASSAKIPVEVPSYYADALNWAYENNLVDEQFADAPCTRASAMWYIWQAKGRPTAQASGFTDVDDTDPSAEAISWAVENGVTDGTGNNTFTPDRVCSRGEIITFLYRAYH